MFNALLPLAFLVGGDVSAPETASTPAPAPVIPSLQEEEAIMNKWTGAVSFGGSISEGNTDSRSASAVADAQYRREKDRTTLGLTWNYLQDKATGNWNVTQRRTYGRAQYDYFFNPKTYGLAQLSAESDKFSLLDLRTTYGLGVGHQFREDDTLKINAEVGLAWVDEDFKVGTDSSYVAARGAYNIDYVINPKWNLLHRGEIFPSLEDSDDVYARLDTRLKITLTEKMFAQLQWLFDWDNTPATGAQRDDNRYLATLGWSF
jgi:putative salt-induced outer membrane protein YdiY